MSEAEILSLICHEPVFGEDYVACQKLLMSYTFPLKLFHYTKKWHKETISQTNI